MNNKKERAIALLASHAAVLWWVFPRALRMNPCIEEFPEAVAVAILVATPAIGLVAAWIALGYAGPDERAHPAFWWGEAISAGLVAAIIAVLVTSPFDRLTDQPALSTFQTCMIDRHATLTDPL